VNAIRSLDWRFLLPLPPTGRFERLALLGADEATLRAAVEAGVAADVVDGLDGNASANAVVCLQRARIRMEAVVATLAPDGVLYLEFERGLRGRREAAAAARTCAGLGLHLIGRYWPSPSLDEPTVYLPLDMPRAVAWYFENVFVISTLRARLLATPTRLAALAAGPRLSSLAPRLCMVLSANAPVAAPGVLSAARLPEPMRSVAARPLVVMSGGWWSRVVVLPFGPGAREPLGAVKLWRTPGDIGRVEREQEAQRMIRSVLPPGTRDAVPEPLALTNWLGHVVSVETSARGQWLMARRHQQRRLAAHLRELELVAKWLTDFSTHAQVARQPWSGDDITTWFGRPLAQYRDAFDMTSTEQRFEEAVLRRASELVGATMPFVWCHNDFSELNIHVGEDSLSVVDWEGLGAGLPATDLLYYLPRWLYRARRMTREETFPGFSRLFVEDGTGDRAVAAARAVLRSYTAAMALDERLPPLLLAGEWIRRAVGRHGRMFQHEAPSPASARGANRFTRYVGILADNTDVLFERPYRWGSP
jgi:aminoglycoside phosphotransferase (APT) family kinase protein